MLKVENDIFKELCLFNWYFEDYDLRNNNIIVFMIIDNYTQRTDNHGYFGTDRLIAKEFGKGITRKGSERAVNYLIHKGFIKKSAVKGTNQYFYESIISSKNKE